MVEVHHDEGVANRIDPESCAGAHEGIGEALTGERIGHPLSRESTLFSGADVVPLTEGKHGVRVNTARVVKADIIADNGVIHVIDKVLLPR